MGDPTAMSHPPMATCSECGMATWENVAAGGACNRQPPCSGRWRLMRGEIAARASSDLPIHIRPVSQDAATRELRFVRETTVKVRWPRRAGLPWEEWEAMHGPQVDGLLARADTTVAESGGVILGYLSHVWSAKQLPDNLSGNVVLMLYVKAAFRGEGIGLTLLRSARMNPGASAIRAWMPTAPWGRWCDHHGIAWERARL